MITTSTASRQEIADQLTRRIASQYTPPQLESLLFELAEAEPSLMPGRLTNREELRRVVDHYLAKLSIDFRPAVHRFATSAMPISLGLAFGGRFENRVRLLGKVDALETWFRQGTVVLACTHSSNLDALVLGAALARLRLPPCVYPAGKHVYRNAWAARMVSSLGGYQLDRSLAAPLYKKLVVEYSAYLIEEGCHSVIFASGTRSRSGEVESRLKLGLLGSVLRAQRYRLAQGSLAKPIFVVPVTINHRVVPEARVLMQYHLDGRQQERVVGDEMRHQGGPWAMAKRVAGFEEQVSLCFGGALSPLGLPVDSATSLGPEDAAQDAEHTRRLGEGIARAFRCGTRFESTHVVARALHDIEGANHRRAIDRNVVLQQIENTRRLLMRHSSEGSLMDTCATATSNVLLEEACRSWQQCHQGGVIRCVDGTITILDLPLLGYYRNRSLHIHN